jgi:predicted 2-oxoglutarate/Fe(II)-dependent dioxygenase YbiX
MLSDLREAIDGLAERDGLDEQVCALSRVYGGLMRQWAFA